MSETAGVRCLIASVSLLASTPLVAGATPMHADLGVGRLDATLVTQAADARYSGLAQGRAGASAVAITAGGGVGVQVRPALALLLSGMVVFAPSWTPPGTPAQSLLFGVVGPELDFTPDPAIPFHVRAGMGLAFGRVGQEAPILSAAHVGSDAWLAVARERRLGSLHLGLSFSIHGTWMRGGSGTVSSSVNAFTPMLALTLSNR